ncbi:hypothetical protein [Gallaecimonas xiamenensis]|uniref:DUF4157 domain-containing protein n=1 Tax=Gallaecimonas xiamenensis 3-C-1 TaxID=745411 RepID=K2J397_9GAMM|nr:hypothetical protein [Gallaecimonas xiamenensis]EKE69553.1 hypothetical protein B3C1_14707 [Gallaecimonas xiamenensis 3-C-1]
MIPLISQWITDTNLANLHRRQPCSRFAKAFAGFYPPAFLDQAYYVVTEHLPKPDFPALRDAGLGDFIDMPAAAITYQDTYYITPEAMGSLRTHFHELVHVVQWQQLGLAGFIQRYLWELSQYGYRASPLEEMAYDLDAHFGRQGQPLDVQERVQSLL